MTTADGVPDRLDGSSETRSRRMRSPLTGLRASERRLLLRTTDILLLCLSLAMAVGLRTELLPDVAAALANIKWFVTLAVVWLLFAAIFDVYDLRRTANIPRSTTRIAAAVGTACLAYLFIPWFTPPPENRSLGFLFIAIAVISVALWRLIYAGSFAQSVFQRRLMVVGAGRSGQDLADIAGPSASERELDQLEMAGYELVGYVDDDPALVGQEVRRLTVLGASRELVRLVKKHDVDEVVIAITHTETIVPALYEAVLDCTEMGVPVVSMTTLYERLTGRVAVEHASQDFESAIGQSDNPLLRLYSFTKRIVDLVGAFLAAIPFLIFIPLVALANFVFSPGPLFFRQLRVGKGGRPFEVVKFRSMKPQAEAQSGAVWASENDARVTTLGRWLRRTHIDELPQVINVFKGDMSLVGPRPERPMFVAELSQSIPFYRARHAVKPGITGWAQIHQDYGDSYERAKEKLEYDLYYLKQRGPVLDTEIMLRTITKVLGLKGR